HFVAFLTKTFCFNDAQIEQNSHRDPRSFRSIAIAHWYSPVKLELSPSRLFVEDDEGIDAEARRQLGFFVQFDQCFEYFRIDALGRFFCADVLLPEHLTDPHHSAPEFSVAIGLR